MERQRGMKFMDRHGWEGGGGLHITIWLYQSISLKYWLTCTCVSTPPPSLNAGTVYEGAFFSPPHRASPAWKNRVFLSTFFLYSWQEGSLWKKKKRTQPVATVIFLCSSSCSPWLRLSLYWLPSQGSNLPGLCRDMIKDPQATHGGSSWCRGVMLMNTHWHAYTRTQTLTHWKAGRAQGRGGGVHSCHRHQWL